jgi:hypothetical protein
MDKRFKNFFAVLLLNFLLYVYFYVILRNQRSQMLIDFCERNGLIFTNTWFKKPKRRLYTWKAPGDWSRHQLGYILVKHRFKKIYIYIYVVCVFHTHMKDSQLDRSCEK